VLFVFAPLELKAAFRVVFVLAVDQDTVRVILPLRSTTGANRPLPSSLIILMTLTRSAYCLDLAIGGLCSGRVQNK
jgi:hypothetical protein